VAGFLDGHALLIGEGGLDGMPMVVFALECTEQRDAEIST
jgi:hypothetical protein